MFVQNSDGFIRLNLACPRAMLQEGMRRICDAVNGHVRHNGRDKEAASDRKTGQAWQNGRVCMDEGGVQRSHRNRNGLLPAPFATITAGRIPRLALWHNQEPSRRPRRPMHTRCFCYETAKSRRKTAGHALPNRAATADKTRPLGLHKMMEPTQIRRPLWPTSRGISSKHPGKSSKCPFVTLALELSGFHRDHMRKQNAAGYS